jgi:hypothetical protein
VSGSEDGKVYAWETEYNTKAKTSQFEIGIEKSVYTTDWNPKYHMLAISGKFL